MVSQGSNIPDLDETIVALSSPPGPGLRAIVRLSGRDAARIIGSLVPEFRPDPIGKRQVVRGGIVLPGMQSPCPAEVFYFRAPATYTGQDIVELHTISCMPLVELTISELLRNGARGAQPGEFTMRGFLAGKLDLTRAEAVHAVIDASGPDQLKHALGQLAGGVARPLDALRDDLLNLLADVEAGLDFSDEDISFVEQPQLLSRLAKGLAQVTLVGRQIDSRGTAAPAFRVVLAGPPNAGKSSLFNALVGTRAALVSPIAGTTRDYLEADLEMSGVAIRLIDTAGLASPTGTIDAAAQDLGRERIGDADLVLWCNESAMGKAAESLKLRRDSNVPMILVRTKSDLAISADDVPLAARPPVPPDRSPRAAHTGGQAASGTDKDSYGEFAVSAVTGFQLAELKSMLAERARVHSSPLAPSLSRCRHHVDACLEHLRRAHRNALDRDPAELLALELRLALDELGAIVGAVYTDDLLDRIFGRFCIGK